MAEGILGLGAGQAASLNSTMLEKLKAVDRKATVEPLEKSLEKFTSEKEALANISAKVEEFLSATKIFSLNQTKGVNAFNQKSANVMGDGVVFDAPDLSALKNVNMRVEVQNLAQKDVWQTDAFNFSKDELVNQGVLKIRIGDVEKDINTDGKTYKQLAQELNDIEGLQASLVDSSGGKFRLSIKSTQTGEENKIHLSESAANTLFHVNESDPNTLKKYHVLEAKDMLMTIDGVEYTDKTNSVTVDGLKVTATKKDGASTINIENDTSALSKQMQEFANKFNELKAQIENEVYSSESSIYDKATLRDMLAKIKNHFFDAGSSDKSIFSFGFSLDDKSGNLNFNANQFEKATKNGTTELEALFAGTPDKKGIATSIDETISISGIKKGLIDYELNMMSREEKIKKEKEEAEKTLDSRYAALAQQFATYGVIINQMESSFSGLKMMIMQSIASK